MHHFCDCITLKEISMNPIDTSKKLSDYLTKLVNQLITERIPSKVMGWQKQFREGVLDKRRLHLSSVRYKQATSREHRHQEHKSTGYLHILRFKWTASNIYTRNVPIIYFKETRYRPNRFNIKFLKMPDTQNFLVPSSVLTCISQI